MSRVGVWLFVLVLLSGCSEPAAVSDPPVDEAPLAYFVDMETMRQLLLNKAQIIDVRGLALFSRLHIPGAIHVKWETFTTGGRSGALLGLPELKSRVAQLNLDPNRDVVVVGSFHDGWGEEGRMAWLLRGMGLPRVFILKGGFKRWETMGGGGANGLSVPLRGRFKPLGELTGDALAIEVAAAKDGLLLDVRTPDEHAGATPYGSPRGGHIEGSVNLNFEQFFEGDDLLPIAQIRELPALKDVSLDQPILVYCTAGVRSAFVACALADVGFTNVRNYSGSWWEWSTR